ncbi:hypothetical protein AZI87_12560 [Bdellovibrio bacteriovorus]|uniref:Glycosyl transferase family 1 domain-containing protein n=1 Tax=Bdellovibrio bacteriovorus TaxID=959 RepID=A0A162G9R7_BDEBC|nr:glycosyltransferase family 1 protein [Bdellovibrio bacteriovorus]KYG65375.1 hypothetical protein AZI87_12560 [Bdellovibrio bacteriovorus]
MRIYFDVSTLNPQKVTGVGVYMLQLLEHFSQEKDLEVHPAVKISRYKNKKNIESILPGRKAESFLPLKWSSDGLYHGPDFKLNVKGFLPRIVTIHDMIVFEEKYNRPEFFLKGIRDMTNVLNSSVDAVIVNSLFTKSQVLKYFPQLEDRLHLTYLGCNRSRMAGQGPSLGLPEKYILFLATLEKRKNVLGVIRAFEALKVQGFEEKLVLAGAWGFGAEEIQRALESSPFKNDIIHLNYVPTEKLSELYQRARVFFFPSWYEGFGIPVLEAMSLGTPVVTSAGGVLEEISGDAASLVDPGSPTEMAAALSRVLTDQAYREALIQKGLKQAPRFTWEKCAQDTVEVYKKVLGRS